MTDAAGNGRTGPHAPPKIPGKDALRAALPKRFYQAVAVKPLDEGGFAIELDARSVKTPKKRALACPTRSLAEAIAAEWAAQREVIDPATMPMTRIANSAIDAVSDHQAAVRADIAAFAHSDLLCYRAASPEGLARRQAEAWEPIVLWAETLIGTRLERAEGVMPVEQPAALTTGVLSAIQELHPLALAALHVITTLTGSALLALALAKRRLSPDVAWAAAHIDEDWQIEEWGEDAEAAQRRAYRHAEFSAAAQILALLEAG